MQTITINPKLVLVPVALRTRSHAPQKEVVAELAENIKHHGQQQPIGVYALDEADDDGHEYALSYGEHRLEACKELGIEVRAEVKEKPKNDTQAILQAFSENEAREALNPMDRLNVAKLLIANGKIGKKTPTQKDVAGLMGLQEAEVSRLMKLDKLSEFEKMALSAGNMNMFQANALLAISDEKKRMEVAEKVVASTIALATKTEISEENLPAGHKCWTAAAIIDTARRIAAQAEKQPKVTTTTTNGEKEEKVVVTKEIHVQRRMVDVISALQYAIDTAEIADTVTDVGTVCNLLLEFAKATGDGKDVGATEVFDGFLGVKEKKASRK